MRQNLTLAGILLFAVAIDQFMPRESIGQTKQAVEDSRGPSNGATVFPLHFEVREMAGIRRRSDVVTIYARHIPNDIDDRFGAGILT